MASVLCAAGCSKPLAYESYREATGVFTADVPIGWPHESDDAFSRRPIAVVSWIGKRVAWGGNRDIGVILEVKRLTRKAHPVPKGFERYRRNVLAPTDDLFSGRQPEEVSVEEAILSGQPARRYVRDFEQVSSSLKGSAKQYPSRVEGVVIQTPTAYYVLEYRATKELFDTYRPAFERLTSTFVLGPGIE